MKITRCFILITLATLVFGLTTTVQAKKPTFSPLCEDTPIPDPITQFESLPVHVKLAKQADEYNAPKRIRCQSKHFKYVAAHDGKQLEVVSHYKSNGRLHAKYLAAKENKISGRFEKHGVLTTFWPNGNKQGVEYYWHGFAIGFHQYFDQDGNLAYVVNYSQSGYENGKAVGHDLFTSKWHLTNHDLAQATQFFREVYQLENGQAVRKAFAFAGMFYPSWLSLDNASSIGQWTQAGVHGTVTVGNEMVQLVNSNFDFVPFAEAYQRHKQGLATLRPPKSYHPEILACPWIDEAMHLGLNDSRFKLPAVKAYSADEIAASPYNRYAACLAKPNANCLMEQTYENLQFESNQKSRDVSQFARAALVMGFPEWTRKATIAELSETRAFSLPNPVFAEPASLKAQAELALGLNEEAQQTIATAFEHAFTEKNGYSPSCCDAVSSVIPLLLVDDHPAGTENAKTYYQYAYSHHIPKASAIIETKAIALARQGNTAAAMQLADEFFPKAEKPSLFSYESQNYGNTADSNRIRNTSAGYSKAYESDRKDYLSALLALALGRKARGDLPAAQAVLGELETHLYSNDAPEFALKVASAYARTGNTDKAIQIFNGLPKDFFLEHNSDADLAGLAIGLCKAGKKPEGLNVADKMTTKPFASFGNGDISKMSGYIRDANPLIVEQNCGDFNKAKARFKEILLATDRPFQCHSDVCYGEYYPAQKFRQITLNAGFADLVWEQKSYDDPYFGLLVALDYAKNGRLAEASSRFDSLTYTLDKGKYPDTFMRQYLLARAHILSLLGRNAEAEAEFAKAKNLALNAEGRVAIRANALMAIAKTYAELNKKELALATANEAFTLAVEGVGIDNSPNLPLLNELGGPEAISLFAGLGSDPLALELVATVLEPWGSDHFTLKYAGEQSRARILGEVAMSRFQQDLKPESLADIKAMPGLTQRLDLWLRASKIAVQQDNDDGLAEVKAALTEEVANLPISLGTITENLVKRQAIHLTAKMLRDQLLPSKPESQLATLQILSQQAETMSKTTEGARALCELAYTAQKLNQLPLAITLFDKATTLATKRYYESSFPFPMNPPALGACAFWLKAAGESYRANLLIAELLKGIPQTLDSANMGYVGSLIEVAFAYAEYEKGEAQWRDNFRLEP